MSTEPAPRALGTRSEFVAAVHETLDLALAKRARRLLWADADFTDWPLDDPALLQRLVEWLRLPQRQLLLLAADYEGLRRRCSRFMALYGLWSHAIAARVAPEDEAAQVPCLLLADHTVVVHLMDKAHWRGWIDTQPTTLRLWQERTDALLQRTQGALPVNTLGL